MSEQPPSWSDLGGNRQPAEPRAVSEFDLMCASVFNSGNGRTLLAELRRRYVDNPGNPLADERALRVRATQHHFVRDLELAAARGLAAGKKAS